MFELEEQLWWYSGMRAITTSILDRVIDRNQIKRVLDIGCGTGYSLQWLQEQFPLAQCVGVDVSRDAAAWWSSRRIDSAVLASADKLPFPSGVFDLVTCFDVIYQFDVRNAGTACAEFARVLAPQGRLLIREPAYDWLRGAHDRAVSTVHRFTARELKRLLEAAGLDILRTTYANTLLFLPAVIHRMSATTRDERSDVRAVSPVANGLLESLLKLEAWLVRRANLPFGLSVIALAVKK